MTRPLTLYELNSLVKDAIEMTLTDHYWVQAELANVSTSRGHCYMELVETQAGGGFGFQASRTPIAQARACCWKSTWEQLEPFFVKTTGEALRRGMKVLLCVKANYHVAYGFSWIVTNIDPTYTMGDMAQRRQEIIRQLKAEGVFDLNKTLSLSPFAKRIAVISSATAAGYGDFCHQLADNDYGFRFKTQLFDAIMQGEQVEPSIISALNCIANELYKTPDAYDAVVIIRGGGSTADLSGFDTLALAENVANFPLPVITGIGHDRDQSVIDLVAFRSVKTPTAVAAMLIDNLAATLERIEDLAHRATLAVRSRMERERMRIETISIRIPIIMKTIFEREQHRLQMLEQRATALDPVNILRRGYSITLLDGKPVTDAKQLNKSDRVTVMFAKGEQQMQVM